MIHWIIDSLMRWLIDGLIDCLLDWLIGCLMDDWLIDWLIEWLSDWLTDRFICELIDSLMRWFIESVSRRLNDLLIQWFVDSPTHSFTASVNHLFVCSLNHWFIGSQSYWIIDSLLDRWLHCFTNWPIHWLIVSLIKRFIRSVLHGCFHVVSLASQPPCAYLFVNGFHNFNNSLTLHLKNFRTNHRLPIVLIFEASAPSRAGHYLVYTYVCKHIYKICPYTIHTVEIHIGNRGFSKFPHERSKCSTNPLSFSNSYCLVFSAVRATIVPRSCY